MPDTSINWDNIPKDPQALPWPAETWQRMLEHVALEKKLTGEELTEYMKREQ